MNRRLTQHERIHVPTPLVTVADNELWSRQVCLLFIHPRAVLRKKSIWR